MCPTLGGRLYGLVRTIRHYVLALVLGRQREVHGVSGDQVQESVDHPWVEMATPTGLDLFQRLVQAERWAVDAVGHHCLEGVGHGNDARAERDVLALEALGIAGTVK